MHKLSIIIFLYTTVSFSPPVWFKITTFSIRTLGCFDSLHLPVFTAASSAARVALGYATVDPALAFGTFWVFSIKN